MDIIKQLEELNTYTAPEQNKIRWNAMEEIEQLRKDYADMDRFRKALKKIAEEKECFPIQVARDALKGDD